MRKALFVTLVAVVSLSVGFTAGWFFQGQSAANEAHQLLLANSLSRASVAAYALHCNSGSDNSELTKLLLLELESGVDFAAYLTDLGVQLPSHNPRLIKGLEYAVQYATESNNTALATKANDVLQNLTSSS